MAADKVYRVLSMYSHMMEGGVIMADKLAERYDISVRSVMRDIADIREFLEKRAIRSGVGDSLYYDRKLKGYKIRRAEAPPSGKRAV